jgi:hypothetical protein
VAKRKKPGGPWGTPTDYKAAADYERSKRPPPPPRDPTKVYFQDIPQFTRHASYRVDVPWHMLEDQMNRSGEGVEGGLQMDPDFQRAHVWTEEQQIRYIEFCLRGGMTGRDVYWNCPNFNAMRRQGPFVLVDGKQRLTAILRFLHNEIPAFGHKFSNYGDRLPFMEARVSWWVNDLPTRAEVLQWYCDLNSGGTIHTPEEIEKVKALLAAEKAKCPPESTPGHPPKSGSGGA